MFIWKERIYLKLKVYNSPNSHILSLNACLLEFYWLCYPGICGIDRVNSAWQMEKSSCPPWMGSIRSVHSLDQLLCALWLAGTAPQITRIHSCPKPVAFTKWLAEGKTRLCCALGEQREASICCPSLLAIKIALGIDSASGKEGGTEGDHLASD